MIAGHFCHLLYGNLLMQMCFNIGNCTGKWRVKGLWNERDTSRRAAFKIIAEQMKDSLFGIQSGRNIRLLTGLNHVLKNSLCFLRVFRINTKRKLNQLKEIRLLTGNLKMEKIGAIGILNICKKKIDAYRLGADITDLREDAILSGRPVLCLPLALPAESWKKEDERNRISRIHRK